MKVHRLLTIVMHLLNRVIIYKSYFRHPRPTTVSQQFLNPIKELKTEVRTYENTLGKNGK